MVSSLIVTEIIVFSISLIVVFFTTSIYKATKGGSKAYLF